MTIFRDGFLLTPPVKMKIQPDRTDKLTITAYSESWIAVNNEKYTHSLFVSYSGQVTPWIKSSSAHITTSDLDFVCHLDAEILLLGTWSKQKMPDQQVLFHLYQKGIGVESMDTAAACRTFNILANEGRKVCAILLLSDHVIA